MMFSVASAALAADHASSPLELRSLIQQVLVQHPSLQSRDIELNAAESDVQTARWQFWPTPSVWFERPDKALIAGTDRQVTMVSLRQPLWTGGRLEANLTQAQYRKLVAEAVRQETLKDIVLEVIQGYGDALIALKRVRAFETSEATHSKMLDLIRRRTQEGVSNESEIYLAQSRLEAIRADLQQAKSQLYFAFQKINTHVGQNLPVNSALSDLPRLNSGKFTADLSQALQIDPVLHRLKAEAAELHAILQSKDAELWPEVHVSVTQRRGDVTGQSTAVAVGLQTRWGGGMASFSVIEAARQRYLAKQGDLEFRARKLSEQVASDMQFRAMSLSRAETYQRALKDSQLVAASWDRQFMAGKKSWQDVMNALREVTQLEVQLAEANVLAGISEWRLTVLTQGSTSVLRSATLGEEP